MKTLLLMRHAKSSWKDDSLTDVDRPLNNRGSRDTPFMGKLLREKQIQPDLVISSPALRAITTAKVIAGELGYEAGGIRTDEALYHGNIPAILALIARTEDTCRTLIVVGHNPGISLLANRLSDTSIEHFPTCSVACFRFEIDSWQAVTNGPGKLEFFEQPKKYFR
jgi:phosphohistidine phosphatase